MTFAEFYRNEYVPRHAQPACQRLHVLGLLLMLVYGAFVAWLQIGWLWFFLPVFPYACGALGHWVAHNHPNSREHPLYSFLAYWKMMGRLALGRRP